METCCAHRVVWHLDGSGLVVWTDALCDECTKRYHRHFWMNFLTRSWN